MPFIRSTIWLDANGFSVIKALRTNATASVIAAALQAVSNSGQLQYWESPPVTPANPATAAIYQSNKDQAVLFFQCADATLAQLEIPAPLASIFMADADTVDPANALVILLIAACLAPGAELLSASGSPAVAYTGGRRQ